LVESESASKIRIDDGSVLLIVRSPTSEYI
jgi:hypothetical protein